MTTPAERDALIEAVVSAHRARDPYGEIRPSPAFFDLEAEDRVKAFDAALEARAMEQALDPAGLSTTARAILARLR
ncbi:MAG: hypothetical protein U0414_36375 [Polyangiaceae bacterium]